MSLIKRLDGVTACVVYTADSIRKFDSKSNRTADSIRDMIRTQKNDSQVPNMLCVFCAVVLLVVCKSYDLNSRSL